MSTEKEDEINYGVVLKDLFLGIMKIILGIIFVGMIVKIPALVWALIVTVSFFAMKIGGFIRKKLATSSKPPF